MKVGSLFAGIGGFDLAFTQAGAHTAWLCEADKYCRQVLGRHWPGVPIHTDIREFTDAGAVDVVCGGWPCQDLSTANSRGRKGLGGERSGLWHEMRRVISDVRPRWVVGENVPGLLSHDGGRDFGVVLRGLADLGYSVAYRVLDAQFFGVPQRRRRVFVVASLGDAACGEVLLEQGGVPRDIAESGGAGEGHPAPPEGGARIYHERTESLTEHDQALALRNDPSHNAVFVSGVVGFGANQVSGKVDAQDDCAPTIRSNNKPAVFGYYESMRGETHLTGDTSPCLRRHGEQATGVVGGSYVRRLTPMECCRLQGFPDYWNASGADFTMSDSQRYKQLGNAVAVPVVRWIAERLIRVDSSVTIT